MTKITHKGLWFKYSSLSKKDKNITKKFCYQLSFVAFL
jgi:hypothetical protein